MRAVGLPVSDALPHGGGRKLGEYPEAWAPEHERVTRQVRDRGLAKIRHRVRLPEIVCVEHPEYGTALVRDNKPMQEKALERCLLEMTPREWYEHLNRRVFFWVERKRLLKLLGARAYRDRPHLVLEVETAGLLKRHGERVLLSPINSGATFALGPAPRGPETFRRIAEHPDEKPIVELCVDYSVPDIAEFTLRVGRWWGTEELEEVWSHPG